MVIKQVLWLVIKVDVLSHYLNRSRHPDINWTFHIW
jgi:hypothetical protein